LFVPERVADLSPLGIQMGWGSLSRRFAGVYGNPAP
jgi:hypothetical protein